MTIIQSIVLGLVEGITEYLPISSTGHLILAGDLMHMANTMSKEALDAFEIVIQGGAILAVLGLYFPRVMQMIQGLLGKNKEGLKLFINLVIAFLPAAVIGLALEKVGLIDKLFYPGPVIGALAVGGIFMIAMELVEKRKKKKTGVSSADPGSAKVTITNLSSMQALGIGFFQVVSIWPGTSRSMMTIVGGRLLGMSTVESAEFSFLLGLPTLGAATCYKLYKDHSAISTLGITPVILGIVVATITAAFAVKWLVGYLTKHGLEIFGYYRLVLAAVLAFAIMQNIVTIEPAPKNTTTTTTTEKKSMIDPNQNGFPVRDHLLVIGKDAEPLSDHPM